MNAAPLIVADSSQPDWVTKRNREVHQLADTQFRARRINAPTRDFFTVLLNACAANTYTYAKLRTLANALPGRSGASMTDGGKCLSTVRNYLRALESAELVWIDELGIHITALEPKPELVQPELCEENNTPTLEQIAEQIQQAMQRGDFAEVARLAQQAEALKQAAMEDSAKNCADESKNCAPSLIKNLNDPVDRGTSDSNESSEHAPTVSDVPDTASVRALRRDGAKVPKALIRHAFTPIEQIAKLSRELQHVRNPDERGALLIYRLDCGVGAEPKLLSVSSRHDGSMAQDGARWRELWQCVQQRLADTVPRDEYETWIAPAQLIDVDEDIAIIGVQTIFAVEQIQRCYVPQIAAVLERELRHRVQLQVVIDAGVT